MVQKFTDIEAYADKNASSGTCNKANIFLGLNEYEMSSLLRASHFIDPVRFDLERYLLNIQSYTQLIDFNILLGLSLTFTSFTNDKNLVLIPGGGALPYKPIRDVPFFRVSFFSINS